MQCWSFTVCNDILISLPNFIQISLLDSWEGYWDNTTCQQFFFILNVLCQYGLWGYRFPIPQFSVLH